MRRPEYVLFWSSSCESHQFGLVLQARSSRTLTREILSLIRPLHCPINLQGPRQCLTHLLAPGQIYGERDAQSKKNQVSPECRHPEETVSRSNGSDTSAPFHWQPGLLRCDAYPGSVCVWDFWRYKQPSSGECCLLPEKGKALYQKMPKERVDQSHVKASCQPRYFLWCFKI